MITLEQYEKILDYASKYATIMSKYAYGEITVAQMHDDTTFGDLCRYLRNEIGVDETNSKKED